ncbi:hypothetical protein L1049_013492 [Liquidambar formosana]|uniref:Uncharacterized protein n=1 Tax=Liquidambar formosana TaxID=63359 RepID=A0AAP0RLK1_LIQFO
MISITSSRLKELSFGELWRWYFLRRTEASDHHHFLPTERTLLQRDMTLVPLKKTRNKYDDLANEQDNVDNCCQKKEWSVCQAHQQFDQYSELLGGEELALAQQLEK